MMDTDSGDDESDSLMMPVEEMAKFAWEDIDVCVMDLPEPKKVGKIKTLLRCVGLGKGRMK